MVTLLMAEITAMQSTTAQPPCGCWPAATLWLLADLFGDNETINSLDSPRARRGMFLQLMGVASALESDNEFLGLEADRKSNLDETEREARRLMLRAQEDRIAEEPEVIRKRAIIAGAMADVIQRTLNESKPKKQATDS